MSITDPLRFLPAKTAAGALVAALVCGVPAGAHAAVRPPADPLPPTLDTDLAGRSQPDVVASYGIAATLDAATHALAGRETIRWRNPARQPVSDLCFHLYLNAFANGASSWLRHEGAEEQQALADGGWGWIEIDRVTVSGGGLTSEDLSGDLAFEAPDDANPDDRTVARLRLPRAVAPGEEIEIAVAFTAQLPRVVARTGFHRDFHLVAQWFPKLAAMGRDGSWNCHQFHYASEFAADYGNYDVAVTVPRAYVVGATGRRVSTHDAGGGQVTHRYVQDGVHDFAWTAWPGFVERHHRMILGTHAVDVILLLRPETVRFAGRYFGALGAGLAGFGAAYGPYPYSTLTMVDPPFGADDAGGMEYPTFITTGTHVLSPAVSQDPEGVTIHEFGHQYFYGLLASDEVQESYLDEGINTYATARVMAATYGPETWTYRVWGIPVPFSGITLEHPLDTSARYFLRPAADPIARTSWGYLDRTAYGHMTYSKTALALAQLERLLGPETMQQAMREYTSDWRFQHPETADFVRSLSRSVGQDLSGYFRQTFFSAEVLDYAVTTVASHRRRGPVGVFGTGAERRTETEPEELAGWESEVVVRRLGGVRLPVVTEMTFADGRRARARWDGQERWVRFRLRGPRLVHAEVDPDQTLLLDVDRLNNSLRVEPDRRASRRWGQRVRFWLQNFLETLAALA